MKQSNSQPTRAQFLLVQIVTLARIPLAALFGVLLLTRSQSLQPGEPLPFFTMGLGLAILIVIELTDLFDGRWARRFGVVTEWGAMLDPYSDSISRILVYCSLASVSLISPVVPLAMAIRDITVAYCRITLAKHGKSVSANWSGKIKAGIQGVGGMVALVGPIYLPFIGRWTIEDSSWFLVAGSWFLVAVTFGSGVEYVKAAFAAIAEAQEKSA